MGSAGSLWVEILPKFVGTQAAMQSELVPAANTVGKEAGEAIAKGVEEGAKAAATEASTTIRAGVVGGAEAAAAQANAILSRGISSNLGAGIARDMKVAEDAVVQSSLKMQAASNTASKAAGDVLVAETRLAEARAKYAADSSQVVAAEVRLADAEAKSTLAAESARVATTQQAAAQATYITAKNKVAEAETAGAAKTAEAELATGKLNNTMNAMVPTLGKVESGYAKMGAGIAAVIVVGMGVHAVKAAGDFQASQMRLVTTAGELTANLDMVGKGVLKMAGDVGYSAQELSKGMYTVESAGYHGADALKVMTAAAQGAKTENADLTTVTDAVTSAMQDYHMPADQAALVTSKLVTAVGDGKTTFEQMTGAMSAILPVAANTHISLDEILGDLSAMTLHGMSAQQASQNLADAVRHLASPTAVMTKELAAVGLSAADLSKDLGTNGVQGTMEKVATAIMSKMGPAGTTLLNAFNQSKQAAADADTMFKNLSPAAHKVAEAINNGTMSYKEFRKSGGGLMVDQKVQVDQWLSVHKAATGFSDVLKTGGNASQTFQQAMAKATGDASSLNVALMLTGENAAKTKQNISDIARTTTEAGNNVKGWSEVQGTFNQKMDQFKSSIGAVFIELGTKLLPIVTSMVSGLMSFSHWLADNKVWIGLVASVLGGLLAPIVAVKLALLAWQAATKLVAAAQLALNIVMDANPIMLIVIAIAALVAGVIYAYTHFKWFHDLINTIGTFLKNVFLAVWHALVIAFNAVVDAAKAVGHAFSAAFSAVVDAAKAVGAAFVWLWKTILEPVFNFIGIAVRILVAIVITLFVTPIYLAIKNVLAPGFTWLWTNVIKPVIGFIADIFTWLWTSVIKPVSGFIAGIFTWLYNSVIKVVVGLIKLEIQAFAAIIQWLGDKIVKPVIKGVGDAWDWLYENVIKYVIAGIKLEIKAFGETMSWLWQNIIKPVLDGAGKAFNWFYDHAVRPVSDGVKRAWHDLGDGLKSVWDHIIRPAFDDMSGGVHSVGTAFDKAVTFIGEMWDKLKAVVAKPINFVIDTVLNHGLFSVWNFVQDKLGLNLHIDNLPLVKFAGGGILPGYAPGVDSIHAMLSPGEAILTPDAARAVGHDNILALNSMYAPGRAYAAGGIVNPLQSSESGGMHHAFLGGVFDWVPKAANSIGGAIGDLASQFGDIIAHPVDAVQHLLEKVITGAGNIANGSDLGKMLMGFPHKIIGGLIDKIKSWLSSSGGPGMGGVGVIPTGQHLALIDAALAADGIDRADWPRWEAGMNVLIQRESGWNANSVNTWDSNAKAGHPSGGLTQTIAGTFAANRNLDLPNNMFDPIASIAASINYIRHTYGDISRVQQANPNLPHKGYDSGGWLEPGITQVVNASGHPEPVFSAGQWSVLKKNLEHGSGGTQTHNYYIESTDPYSVAAEVERQQTVKNALKLLG